MTLLRPRWLDKMPDDIEKARAENRFLFSVWRLYATPEGSLEALARLIGVNPYTLASQASDRRSCGATEPTLEAIELLLGPAFMPLHRIPDRRFKE